MSQCVDELLSILDLEKIDTDLFRASSRNSRFFFGGQMIGQALAAATRTVNGPLAHSLHGYFLRTANPSLAIDFKVRRVRDSRSFATRQVDAYQEGREIFCMFASFNKAETGPAHQFDMPQVPPPETLAKLTDLPHDLRRDRVEKRLIDIRPVDFEAIARGKAEQGVQQTWMRVPGTLPDDPALHRAVLAYASDSRLWDTALLTLGRRCLDPDMLHSASIDHAVWFHRAFRADEWLLFHQESTSIADARGYNRGSVYTRDGRLVASVSQENLIRFASPAR